MTLFSEMKFFDMSFCGVNVFSVDRVAVTLLHRLPSSFSIKIKGRNFNKEAPALKLITLGSYLPNRKIIIDFCTIIYHIKRKE